MEKCSVMFHLTPCGEVYDATVMMVMMMIWLGYFVGRRE
jgi:hypothetical protein